MTKRELALTNAKVAGYHGDVRAFTRLVIESRVTRAYLDDAYILGERMKAGGVKCECYHCSRSA